MTPVQVLCLAMFVIACHANQRHRSPRGERSAWVVAELEQFNNHLGAGDRQAKYCKMAASALAFFRGSNHLFWRDFAADPRFASFGNPATRIWLQGDAHAYNMGAYKNGKGAVVYGLNDFDDVVIADYQWDVWRMATSVALTGAQAGPLTPAQIDDAVRGFAQSYLQTLEAYSGNQDERGVRFTKGYTGAILAEFLADVEGKHNRDKLLDQWTQVANNGRMQTRRFRYGFRQLVFPVPAMDAAIRTQLPATAPLGAKQPAGYWAVKDVARRLRSGTGSLGTPRYYVLIEGASPALEDDRILDVKQQQGPSGYPYLSASERDVLKRAGRNHAERTIIGNRALVGEPDPHLAWLALPDGVYSVRERSPYRDSLPALSLAADGRLAVVAAEWGRILATAHARADRDFRPDIIEYSFDDAVAARVRGQHRAFVALVGQIAREYAAQVHRDYQAFTAVITGPCP